VSVAAMIVAASSSTESAGSVELPGMLHASADVSNTITAIVIRIPYFM
jgi:hypothetical protein